VFSSRGRLSAVLLEHHPALAAPAPLLNMQVRQLEALVRLSEATARVYCSPEVRVEHVQEVGVWRRGRSGGRARRPARGSQGGGRGGRRRGRMGAGGHHGRPNAMGRRLS
jgi:hypothetical protein